MLIKNNDTEHKYIVYAIYNNDIGQQYIVFKDNEQIAYLVKADNYVILDETFSSYWITTEKHAQLPKEWDYDMFLEELVDDPAPLNDLIFKKAKEKIDKEFSHYKLNAPEEFADIDAEAIGDNWVLCPECNEAFEVESEHKVVKCSGCYTKLNNPYYQE